MTELNCFVDDSMTLNPLGDGSLSGLKFAVKDLYAIEGHTSSFGVAEWRETHPSSARTSPIVTDLLKDGSTLIGVTKMDQLAYSLIGSASEGEAPHNPLFPDRFTGGSSSGSASAVAGGIADFALGTDTAGSIRVPAAACGLWSVRPTWGVANCAGVLPLAPSLDVPGVLAKSVDVLRMVAKVILRVQTRDEHGFERILVASDCFGELEGEQKEILSQFLERVRGEFELPISDASFGAYTDANVADLFARLQARELWQSIGMWVNQNWDAIRPEIRVRLERAQALSGSSPQEIRADMSAWSKYRTDLNAQLGERTALLIPVMPELPPLRTSTDAEQLNFRVRSFRLTAPSSLGGLPQVVLPVSAGGISFGIGVLGTVETEMELIELAARLGTIAGNIKH